MSETLATALSFGDEAAGRVLLRGHDLTGLAGSHGFEDVAAILWAGVVDAAPVRAALGEARVTAFNRLGPFEALVRGQPAEQAMRLLVAAFASDAADHAVVAVAHIGVAAALSARSQDGLAWSAPGPDAAHTTDLLHMATGHAPEARISRAFERYCILMIDHGVGASTHAARIAASTGASLGGSVLAALCALQGPRHGGAPSLVLDQLDGIQGPHDVPRYVAEMRAEKRRVVGFGSRAYRGRDLRADLLKAEWLAVGGARGRRADAEATEAALIAELAQAMPERGLRTNVEYYAALLLEAVGLPRHAFTPMFAAARAPGWVAHVAEQRRDPRILRPPSRYTGEAFTAPAAQS